MTDVLGTPLSVQPQLFYGLLAGHGGATVSSTGLVTATAPGNVVELVACALGDSSLFTPAGIPINAITAEQSIWVTNGFVPLDFYFTLSLSGSTFTIHQFAETNSTWNGTVQYSLGQKSAYPESSNLTVIATITGTSTATFASPNAANNFKLQANDATNGVFHAFVHVPQWRKHVTDLPADITPWNFGPYQHRQFRLAYKRCWVVGHKQSRTGLQAR